MASAEDILQEIRQLESDYDDILAFYSPATLKEALKNEWDGGDKIDHLLVSLVPYKEKGADKQRLISMKKAMTVLRDLEEQLVGSLIPKWDDIIFDQLLGLYATVIQTIEAIVKYWDLNQARSLVVKVWKVINVGYQISGMVTVATTVFAIERRYELQVANQKMKQEKHAKRTRVKKITRC